jgi:SAM-dependent methyltransferase
LAKKGHRVTVVEKCVEASKILSLRTINDEITIVTKRFEDFQCNNLFDVVIMMETIQYFNNLMWLFKKINKLLRKGGLFLFTGLNSSSPKYIIRKRFLNHTEYPCVANLTNYKDVLRITGFMILKVEAFNWLPFRVNSNSPLIPLFIEIERTLQLKKCLRYGPELMFSAKKTHDRLWEGNY